MAYAGGYPDGYADGGTQLAAQSDGSSTVSGDVAVLHPLAGASAGSSTVAGDLPVSHTLVGASAGASTASGALIAPSFLTGSSAGSSTAAATGLVAVVALAGRSDGRATLDYAVLTQHFTFAVEGSSQAVAGAAGTLGVNYGLEGHTQSRSTASATVVPDPTFMFIPPLSYDMVSVLPSTHGVQRQLFRYYAGNPRGLSVVKVAGHFTTVDNPYAATLVGTDGVDFFLGGHQYTVTKAVAAALLADGYVAV